MDPKTYHQQQTIDNTLKLREQIKGLPKWLRDFFRGIEQTTESRTRIAYAQDLLTFFTYMKDANPQFEKVEIFDLPITLLSSIKAVDIEEYLEFLKVYEKAGKEFTNNERAIKRKLAAIRTMYGYFTPPEIITYNLSVLVFLPKNL